MKSMSALELVTEVEYEVGEMVHHRTSKDFEPGVVTGICLRSNSITYLVTWPSKTETWNSQVELCRDFDPAGNGGGTKTK